MDISERTLPVRLTVLIHALRQVLGVGVAD
jgi:hypothetical protein